MSKGSQQVWFQFEGHPEIISSHNWRLEMDVNLHRNRLGLPFWTRYKTIPNYEPPSGEDLVTLTSSKHDSDLNEPTPVPQPLKKSRSRKKTVDLSPVSSILDEFAPADNLPESPTPGADDTVADSMDSGLDV